MFTLPPYFYFEAGAFITSVVFLYKFNNKPLRWFIIFLLLMVSVELTGLYIRNKLGEVNTWLYNMSIPVEYLFYGFIIGSLCLTKTYRKIVFSCSLLFAIWAIGNLLFIQGFTNLATNNLKIGSILMIFFSGLGLVDLFNNDNHSSLLKNPLFWICTGVLFFNTGEFLYLFFFDVFLKNKWDKTANLFASINNKLIYVLYTCISIAIICSKKSEKKVL
jgi:hypothetical protein